MDNKDPFVQSFRMAPLPLRLIDMFLTLGPEIFTATRFTVKDLYKDAVVALMAADKKLSSKNHRFDLWGSE